MNEKFYIRTKTGGKYIVSEVIPIYPNELTWRLAPNKKTYFDSREAAKEAVIQFCEECAFVWKEGDFLICEAYEK